MKKGAGGSVQGAGRNQVQRHKVAKAQRKSMRKIIFLLIMVFVQCPCRSSSHLLPQIEDYLSISRVQLAQMIQEKIAWLDNFPDSKENFVVKGDCLSFSETRTLRLMLGKEIFDKIWVENICTNHSVKERDFVLILLRIVQKTEKVFNIAFPEIQNGIVTKYSEFPNKGWKFDDPVVLKAIVFLTKKGIIKGYSYLSNDKNAGTTEYEAIEALEKIKSTTEKLLK